MDLGTSRRLSYVAARRLLVLVGLAVLLSTAAVLWVRSVESTEIVAVLLFVPVYLGAVVGRVRGGALAAAVASVVYAALRLGGVDTLDRAEQIGLVASRTIAYFLFGVLGGAAVALLEQSLSKLDRYDVIDDETGLFNSRYLASEIELESARATRYGSGFALVLLDLPVPAFRRLPRRRRATALEDLGEVIRDGLRAMDRPCVVRDGDLVRVGVVLPETDAAGADVVASRLVQRSAELLDRNGVGTSADVVVRTMSHPADADDIGSLQARVAVLAAEEHPVGADG